MNILKEHKELMKKVFDTDDINKVMKMASDGVDVEGKLLPYVLGEGTAEEEDLADDLITILTEE